MIFTSRTPWYGLALFLTAFAGCSCESENADMANPDAIHQAYGVNYDADTNRFNVDARFRFGGATGTNLRLNGLARVTHNQVPMKEAQFLGVLYTAGGEGYQPGHLFEYTDTAGKIRKNTVRLASIDFGPDMPAQISRTNVVKLSFVGDPFEANESIGVILSQPGKEPQNVPSNVLLGANEVTIRPNQLLAFADGEATLRLERRSRQQLQDATSRGGGITTTYRTKSRKVTIVN